MKEQKDFITVRLTADGQAFAGPGATLRIATAAMHYLFAGDAGVKMLRFAEWPLLETDTDAAGKPLFEEVPEEVPAAAPEATLAATTTAAPAPATPEVK